MAPAVLAVSHLPDQGRGVYHEPMDAAVSQKPVEAGQPNLNLVLRPHRSLSPLGFWLVMGGIGGVSFAAGLAFWLAGAWPVFGFFGLDVLLVYWAFKASYSSGKTYETVCLTDNALTVCRVGRRGERNIWSFQPYWLRVDIDDPPNHESALTLSSHGKTLVIGAFLPPWERLEVARILRGALSHTRRLSAPNHRDSTP